MNPDPYFYDIGLVPWTDDDLKSHLEEFSSLYQLRPIDNNRGGMSSPHMFYMWFMLRFLKPKNVIESGVNMGQGTWFIEQAVPDAKIISIDPRPRKRKYTSDKATYCRNDLTKISFDNLDPTTTFCFFDDHQNAYERTKFVHHCGFKTVAFEDNYPIGRGDCKSLKQVFNAGGDVADSLKPFIKTYYEFPPVFSSDVTRWKDPWTNERYPTKKPLFAHDEVTESLDVFLREAKSYTWMAYVELSGEQ